MDGPRRGNTGAHIPGRPHKKQHTYYLRTWSPTSQAGMDGLPSGRPALMSRHDRKSPLDMGSLFVYHLVHLNYKGERKYDGGPPSR